MGGDSLRWLDGKVLTAIPCAAKVGLGLLLGATLPAGAWLLRRYGWRRCARGAASALAATLLALAGSWLASLLLADVIRDAERVYAASHAAGGDYDTPDGWPVWLLLAAVATAGYFVYGKPELRR